MKQLIADILAFAASHDHLDGRELDRLIQARNRTEAAPQRRFAKKMVWPTYCKVRDSAAGPPPEWQVSPRTEQLLAQACRMKPRRTASGVATVTVLTRPHPCQGDCVFCPNDVRMPKSYLHDEPACQRAERNFFDPYLQVASRLRALEAMGHPCDKVELIVLGGTFDDYPESYRIWFVAELFRALNEAGGPNARQSTAQRRAAYRKAGVPSDAEELSLRVHDVQEQVDAQVLGFSQALEKLYGPGTPWEGLPAWQQTTWQQLESQQRANEQASSRCVGLVVETRPEAVCPESLWHLRRLGCTKVQMGVQTLSARTLASCGRAAQAAHVAQAFELLRAFGFKSHVHVMPNLPGRTPAQDAADYRLLMEGAAFQPDEVKVYPCTLVAHSKLREMHDNGRWQPYAHDVLVDLLANDVLATPAHTRISRMVRDFSAGDIQAGCTKANLRQEVEAAVDARCAAEGVQVHEMRRREIACSNVQLDALRLDEMAFDTTNTRELFLQWVGEEGELAGFARVSLPRPGYIQEHEGMLPLSAREAMIREVHVYGRMAQLDGTGGQEGRAQHAGLGKALVRRACQLARKAGYGRIKVISAVGTRPYYRSLGFADEGLYQVRVLNEHAE